MKIEYEYATTIHDFLKQLQAKHGALEKLKERVQTGKATFQERIDLDRWKHHAASGSGSDEVIRVQKAVVFHDPILFFKFLSPERVRILDRLRTGEPVGSLHELADRLGRDPKNVYEDVKALEKRGLVRIERRNRRRAIPHARIERITITV